MGRFRGALKRWGLCPQHSVRGRGGTQVRSVLSAEQWIQPAANATQPGPQPTRRLLNLYTLNIRAGQVAGAASAEPSVKFLLTAELCSVTLALTSGSPVTFGGALRSGRPDGLSDGVGTRKRILFK